MEWVTDNDEDLTAPSIPVKVHSRRWPPTRAGFSLLLQILRQCRYEIMIQPWRIFKVLGIIGFHTTISARADGRCNCSIEAVPHG